MVGNDGMFVDNLAGNLYKLLWDFRLLMHRLRQGTGLTLGKLTCKLSRINPEASCFFHGNLH